MFAFKVAKVATRFFAIGQAGRVTPVFAFSLHYCLKIKRQGFLALICRVFLEQIVIEFKFIKNSNKFNR